MPKPSQPATSYQARAAIALLGDSIRLARIERHQMMEEVAERAGISRALLRRIERGDPGCSVGAVFEVAAVVGVPLFETERHRLAQHIAHQDQKLNLLPAVVRKRGAKAVKDDF